MIQMNIATVNDITSKVSLLIQEGLDNYKQEEFTIRLGTFTRFEVASREGTGCTYKNVDYWKC